MTNATPTLGTPSKLNDEYNNPCLKEHQLSTKCMSENCYDKKRCSLEFMNYRACMDFWLNIRKERRRKGIKPELPSPEERADILIRYRALREKPL